jgi:phosphinothricin acetyltransferase
MSDFVIRRATIDDISSVLEIYSYYVENSVVTSEEVVPSLIEMQDRFSSITKNSFPYLVLECTGIICGYAYAGKFHHRTAYRFTAENTVYVRNGYFRNGYGKALMLALIKELRAIGIKNIVAMISSEESIMLHKNLGFSENGTLKNVEFKFAQWVDVTFMQIEL